MKSKQLFILILFSVLLISGNILAQEKTQPSSFTIIGENDPQKLDFYTKSILNASMEPFRLLNTDVSLKFKEGFECVLFSAKKMSVIKGVNINGGNYLESFPANYILPVFSIALDGRILGEVNRNEKANK